MKLSDPAFAVVTGDGTICGDGSDLLMSTCRELMEEEVVNPRIVEINGGGPLRVVAVAVVEQ